MTEPRDIFDAEFLRSLEALEDAVLRLRGQAGEGLARRGRAAGLTEFRGHRPYAPGDDLRRLDWNAYGRLGRFFMREFERERSEHIHLLVDTSRSMAVGDKHVFARRCAAALGYLALRRGGSVTVGDRASLHGPARLARLLDELRSLEPSGDSVRHALASTAAKPRAPSDLFVLTDALEPLDALRPLQHLSERRCAVTLIVVLAPEELRPPRAGPVELAGLEEGTALALDLNDAALAAYHAELSQHLDGIQLLARRCGWTLAISESTDDLHALFTGKLRGIA